MAVRYYVTDLETGKLNIYTAGKSDWLTLPEQDRDTIKRNCLFSKSRGCWVSKAKASRCWWLDTLKRNGFEDRGQVGEKLTFAEQVEVKQERAADRADRMEDRADAASAEADIRFNSHNIETLRGMQGEPVKLDHYSARRHLRLIEKADNDMRKGCEALSKRDHYRRRAEAAKDTAEGQQYRDPAFLGRRIAEQEAEERDLLRRLDGHGRLDPTQPISDEYRDRLNGLLDDCRDKLGFYRECLEMCKEAGTVVWDRESLKGKSQILWRFGWAPVIKVNRTTVSVPNDNFRDVESQKRHAFKVPFTAVKDAR